MASGGLKLLKWTAGPETERTSQAQLVFITIHSTLADGGEEKMGRVDPPSHLSFLLEKDKSRRGNDKKDRMEKGFLDKLMKRSSSSLHPINKCAHI